MATSLRSDYLSPGRWHRLLAAFDIGDAEVATFDALIARAGGSGAGIVVPRCHLILGADEATYAAFETNVREEYRWVLSILFRSKRAEILESFLARPQIYNTEPFLARLEAPARRNLTAAIATLRR